MSYGIYDISKTAEGEPVVICHNCGRYYYEHSTDDRNANQLAQLQDTATGEIFTGCPLCQSDAYLRDVTIPKELSVFLL